MLDKGVSTATEEPQMFGHPKGLFYLFFAELWERFSFYGMRALLTLYMVEHIFEAIAERDTATAVVYASYGSLVYASTVIGGQISDKILGMRASIFLGGILMALGHFVLAVENDVAFYLALAFIVVGNGFFKPNISTFVGALYKEGDVRKDSGFTIFYMGINIGGFVAPLLCGWLALKYGYHYGFGLAGIGMMAGLIFFWSGIKKNDFGDKGMTPNKEVYEKKEQVTFSDIIAVSIIARDPKGFLGADLVSEMTDAHLYHGKFNAFHRLERLDGSGDVLFSVVSVKEPGHFDMKGIDKQNFEGITLFFRISDFTKSMDTLDLLIKTSKQLSFRLNGELVDWQHKPMNKTALESYKQQIKMIV
mgnify:CR=1 FL=1